MGQLRHFLDSVVITSLKFNGNVRWLYKIIALVTTQSFLCTLKLTLRDVFFGDVSINKKLYEIVKMVNFMLRIFYNDNN